MKFKLIVASLALASSGSVLAATASDNATTQAQLDAMKANVAKLQAIVEQNQAGGFQQPDNWWNRISVSGLANIDAVSSSRQTNVSSVPFNNGLMAAGGGTGVTSSNRSTAGSNFVGHSSSTIALDTANLFIDANASDYTRVHLDISGQTGQQNTHYWQNVGSMYGIQSVVPSQNSPTLNEAYVILGNFNKYPFYMMAGLQNVQFGEYDVYPMVYSFTQLMSQTQATAATFGYVDACTGFNAAVYGFQGLPQHNDSATQSVSSNINNYGAKVGIKNAFDNWGYGVSVDYLSNMNNVNYISLSQANPAYIAGLAPILTGYQDRVSGLAVNGDLVGGAFDAKIRYVQSLGHFAPTQLPNISDGVLQSKGEKPWAAGLDLGYNFLTMQHQSRVGIGYQQSGQAAGVGYFGLPQNRYEAQYVVNVSRYTDLGLDVYYDKDYSTGNGGSGSNATTGVLRLGVKFA